MGENDEKEEGARETEERRGDGELQHAARTTDEKYNKDGKPKDRDTNLT